MRILGIVALGAALGGCASSSADIMPAYVSPVAYQGYTCQQLALEAQSISTRATADISPLLTLPMGFDADEMLSVRRLRMGMRNSPGQALGPRRDVRRRRCPMPMV